MADRRETFDELFTRDPDHWRLETSDYEREKRGTTLAVIGDLTGDDPPRRVLEIGCANGVLTAELAEAFGHVTATDVSPKALELARARLAGRSNVTFARGEAPADWPVGQFDLIVLSEILYFLSEAEIASVSRKAWHGLGDDGACLLVNWTGPNDRPVDGTRAVQIFEGEMPWSATTRIAMPRYRVDRLGKAAQRNRRPESANA